MHSSLQNIRPAQMQNLQHDKSYLNQQHQMDIDHRQVHLNANAENEKKAQQLNEAKKADGKEIDDYLKKKREQDKKKKKKKKGVYKVVDEDGKEELRVDIKI